MADPAKPVTPVSIGALQAQVKSQILQRISDNFTNNLRLADGTQYTKSDGTNYGMYVKSDDFSAVNDVWNSVFPATTNPRTTVTTLPPAGTTTKTGG